MGNALFLAGMVGLFVWWRVMVWVERRHPRPDPRTQWANSPAGQRAGAHVPSVGLRAAERVLEQVMAIVGWGLFIALAVFLTWLVKGRG